MRRIIAAVVALILAGIGIVLVFNYASSADERALVDLETVDVLVAAVAISRGETDDLASRVELRAIPRAFVVHGAFDSLDDLDGLVAATDLTVGEQILPTSFVSPEELRGRSNFTLPDEARALHQLTISLTNPQALGGSIAPGDTVGLFGTFEMGPPTAWTVGPDGQLLWDDDAARSNGGQGAEGADEGEPSSDDTITFTDLVLDKVLVVRVEGGHVATDPDGEGGEPAQDTVRVTLALDPQAAAKVIHSVHTATVWLTLSPEAADEADVRAVIPSGPSRVIGLLE